MGGQSLEGLKTGKEGRKEGGGRHLDRLDSLDLVPSLERLEDLVDDRLVQVRLRADVHRPDS